MNWFYPGKTRGQASATMFAHLHDAGIRPLDIIRAVTTNAAELMDSRSSSHRNPDRLHLCSCRALADSLPQNSLHLFLSIIPKPFRAHFGSLRVRLLLLHGLPSPNGDLVPPQPLANHRVRSPASPRSCWCPPIPQTNTRHRQALNFRGAFPVHLLVIEYPVNHAKLWLRTGVHFVLWTSSHRIAPCSATLVQEAVRRCGFEPRINGHESDNEDSDLSRRSLRRVASSCSMRA